MITDRGRQRFEDHGLSGQADTVDLLVQGLRYKQIAHRTGHTPDTVKRYAYQARKRLGVATNPALAAVVIQLAWVTVDDLPITRGPDQGKGGDNANEGSHDQ